MTVARFRLTASESRTGAPPVAGSSKSGATSPTSSMRRKITHEATGRDAGRLEAGTDGRGNTIGAG